MEGCNLCMVFARLRRVQSVLGGLFGHRVRAERVLLDLSFYAVVKVQKSAICPWWFVWSEDES